MSLLIPSPLQQLLQLLEVGDIDGAIDAGLMDYVPGAENVHIDAPVRQAQQKIEAAWAARDRYRAQQIRLAARGKPRAALPLPLPVLDGHKAPLPPEVAALVLQAKTQADRSRKKE